MASGFNFAKIFVYYSMDKDDKQLEKDKKNTDQQDDKKKVVIEKVSFDDSLFHPINREYFEIVRQERPK